MKTIIAGSRTIMDPFLVEQAITESGFKITTVVSGGAKGADHLAEQWASTQNIPVIRFPADGKTYGRGAGPVRNKEMAQYADACIVIWDGFSAGTKNMIELARKNGLLVHVHHTNYYRDKNFREIRGSV